MLLLWSDILTRAVCAEQAEQHAAQTDKPAPPAEAGSQPNRAATRSTPRSVDAKALDWEIKDISVHRSRCTCILRLSKKNTHVHRGGWKRVEVGGALRGPDISMYADTLLATTPLISFFIFIIISFKEVLVWMKVVYFGGVHTAR